MLIAMHVKVSGGRGDGTDWPDAGLPFEVDDEEGQQLVRAGLAYPVARPVVPPPQAPAGEGKPGTGPAEPPSSRAPKAAWVEHAVAQGMDRAEAEAMAKGDLMAALAHGAGSASAGQPEQG